MILLELFLGFLQVGLFSFGGGYAAVALIREVVSSYGWLTEERLADCIALSESTPGPIMVNLATFVGSQQGGVPGAIVATFAVVLPAFVIILALTAVLDRFLDNPWVKALLTGLKACVTGIILATGLTMILGNCLPVWRPDWTALALSLVLGLIYFGSKPILKKKCSPIALIGLAALLGMVVYSI